MINKNKPVGPNPDWMNKAAETVKKASGPMKLPESTQESIAKVAEKMSDLGSDAIGQIKSLLNPDKSEQTQSKMHIFGSNTDPKKLVESIRGAKGTEQTKLLLGFQHELDEMSNTQLDKTASYLVSRMADAKNTDDPLLGALAKSVMDESASRKFEPNHIKNQIGIQDLNKFVAD